jgi:hypothetical protein
LHHLNKVTASKINDNGGINPISSAISRYESSAYGGGYHPQFKHNRVGSSQDFTNSSIVKIGMGGKHERN